MAPFKFIDTFITLILWLKLQLCLVVIGYAGYYLSRNADIIAEKTGMSGSWIGLILLATATSLPELVTGVTAVTAAQAPNVAVGDALGSTVFNLSILVILDALYKRETLYSHAAQGHILSAALGALLIAFSGFNLLLEQSGILPSVWNLGIYSPFIVLFYIASMRSIHRFEKRTLDVYTEASSERYSDMTLNKALVGYAIAAVAVMLAGAWVPFIATDIAEQMGWKQSFVGTLLVAIVTSAPEVAVTISALRIGALDMAIANLLGSNLFDVLILAIDDFFYSGGALLAHVDNSHTLTVLTAVMMSLLVISGFIFQPKRHAVLKLTWISLGIFLLYILNTWVIYQHG